MRNAPAAAAPTCGRRGRRASADWAGRGRCEREGRLSAVSLPKRTGRKPGLGEERFCCAELAHPHSGLHVLTALDAWRLPLAPTLAWEGPEPETRNRVRALNRYYRWTRGPAPFYHRHPQGSPTLCP